jgi:hypothetical protein
VRVFENRVLTRIFRLKKDEITGGWKKLDNEELYNFHSSPAIMRTTTSRKVRLAGHVARAEARTAYRDLIGKPERDY